MLDGIARNYPDKAVAFDEEEWESVTKWMKGEFHFTEENAAYAEKKYKAMIDNAPDI